ncbi:MAG TPA: L,D-transpeptidase, partial [Longimicrobium sp.]|nr:L,D-transpeptidase [Longimicrobium sp.]
DAGGRILYHFPTTLGSSYDPSPEGSFHVLAITENPWWHYQPAILKGRNPNAPPAQIPPGPNSAVGRVWMTLSAEHYGIHGTKSPETIGYAVSAGCVRLANWDALYLARRLTPGTPVVFRGTRTREKSNVVNRTPAAPARPDTTRPRPDTTRARPDTTHARPDTTRATPAGPDATRRDTSRAKPDSAATAPAAAPAPAQTPAPPPAPVPTAATDSAAAKP